MSDPFGSFGDSDPSGYAKRLAAMNQAPPDFTGSSVMTSTPAPMQFGPSLDDTPLSTSAAPPPPVTGEAPPPMSGSRGKTTADSITAMGFPNPSDADMTAAKAKEDKSREDVLALQKPMQDNLTAAQAANTDYANSLKERAATIDATMSNMPKDTMAFVMKQSPLFLGLAALAGGQFRSGALTGLSAMNGAVKGIVEGDRQAYDDAITQYRNSLAQMQAKFDLQDKTYAAAQKNFGLSAEANQLALQFTTAKLGWATQDMQTFQAQKDNIAKLLWTANQQDKQFAEQEKVAGIRANASTLDQAQMSILAAHAADGTLDPYRVNSRTGKMQAGMFAANPSLDMNQEHSHAALMSNPNFMTRQKAAEMLPQIIANVTAAGKAVGFDKVQFAGKLQKYLNGQLNDPAFINYMSQRNDALMAIAAVMRNVGMSDKAIDKEYEASPATMDPAAYDAWANGQMAALGPRLKMAGEYTGNKVSDTLPPPSKNATLGGTTSFATMEEAQASGLPAGTRVTVGGVSGSLQQAQ